MTNQPQYRFLTAIMSIFKSSAVGLGSLVLLGVYLYDFVKYLAGVDHVNIFADSVMIYLFVGIALGVILYLGIDYWTSWQNVRRKRGDVAFSMNYLLAMFVSMAISGAFAYIILTVGFGVAFPTWTVDNPLLTMVIALFIAIGVSIVLDHQAIRKLADGIASAALVKAKTYIKENYKKWMQLILDLITKWGGNPSDEATKLKALDMLKDYGQIDKDISLEEIEKGV